MTVYNSNADGQDLFTLTDDLVNTDSTQYPVKAKARAFNKCLKDIWTWIFFAYGGWQYDDTNQTDITDLVSTTATLTSGTDYYAIPSTALTVKGVEVKDAGGIWHKLDPITVEQIQEGSAIGEFLKTAATPLYYVPHGDIVKIYPAPNWTQANSIKIFYDRGSVQIASTATSTSPGFASEFHEALSYGAALIFAKRKGLPQVNALAADWADYERRIKKYYSQRYADMFPARVTVRDAVQENQ